MEKYGFVYLWYNKIKKKFYIGSHWGYEDDGYICSSNWCRNSINRHPDQFMPRRTLSRIFTNRKELLEKEHQWLSLIKDEELGKRYYNLRKFHFNHWSSKENNLSIREKIRQSKLGKPSTYKGKSHSEKSKEKMRQSKLGKILSDEHKQKIKENNARYWKGKVGNRKGTKTSEETKRKMSLAHLNKIYKKKNKKLC